MPKYVDGFVVPVPKKNLEVYRKIAKTAGKIWKEHGALAYIECVGEDLKVPYGPGFPKGIKAKPSETIIFSWIVYKSRAHRDEVNANVMKDPRIAEMGCEKGMPFDGKRMLWGGFSAIVEY